MRFTVSQQTSPETDRAGETNGYETASENPEFAQFWLNLWNRSWHISFAYKEETPQANTMMWKFPDAKHWNTCKTVNLTAVFNLQNV